MVLFGFIVNGALFGVFLLKLRTETLRSMKREFHGINDMFEQGFLFYLSVG